MQLGDGSDEQAMHMDETSSESKSGLVAVLFDYYLQLVTDAPRLNARRLGKSNIFCLL